MDETFINNLAQALRKIGTIHTVGEEWHSYSGQIPTGGVPYCGQEVTRETYSALWYYAQYNGLVISEAEWQQYAQLNGGNCKFYSSGDGSTSFRMPKIVGYVKGASALSESGLYIPEGLPTHTHTRGTMNITGTYDTGDRRTHINNTTGAFYRATANDERWSGMSEAYGNTNGIGFDASRSWTGETSAPTNSIYGRSSHVTPETSTVLFGVYAFGVVVEAGALDATTLAQAVSRAETSIEGKLSLTGGTMTGTTVSSLVEFVKRDVTDSYIMIQGGANWETGATLEAFGKDNPNSAGQFKLWANDGTNVYDLTGTPDGTLAWGGKFVEVIASQGHDWVRFDSGIQICWGSMSGDTWVSFQQPFADLSYSVTIAGVDSNDTWNATIYSDKTTSAIHMWSRNVSKIEWTAIGRWK